ncbi:MAG: glycine cleavage system protein GcvH [Nitrospirae bacterium]|nr:glycine cleavage system protein GcvH [Nitrospirota bacterium]
MSSERRYTTTHEWISPVGPEGRMRVGITDFAQKEITDVVFVELPKIGKKVETGGEVAIIESVKAAFSIYAPLGGEVVSVNEKIENNPGLVNDDPYGEGWLFELKVFDPAQLSTLPDEAAYQKLIVSGGGH